MAEPVPLITRVNWVAVVLGKEAPFCTKMVMLPPDGSCAAVKAGTEISSSWFSVKNPLLFGPRSMSSVVTEVAEVGRAMLFERSAS